MEGWTLDINGTSISPAEQVERVLIEDQYWLVDNLLPIVVPIKDVGVEFVKNAIFGIPRNCPIVFVSATDDDHVRAQERSVVKHYNGEQDRDILWIPQSGERIRSFLESNYDDLVRDGEVISGYREALLIGSFAVKSLEADCFGVVDGDNWSPMAIREFVLLYARGLRRGADYVSLEWRCKPKCGDNGFEWEELGRVSRHANTFMDMVCGADSMNVITSSCSGDHAVRMDTWDSIKHTANHSGEVNAFVKMIEGDPPADVAQYKTMSPLFHQYGSSEHIEQELTEVLKPIFHSQLSGEQIREEILEKVSSDVEDPNRTYGLTENVGSGFLESLEESDVV